MSIELIVRVPFYAVTLVLLAYSHAAFSSTVLMAIAAWAAFGHPGANSGGQEVVAFVLTYGLAVISALLIGFTVEKRNVLWLVSLELRLLHAETRRDIRVEDVATYFLALGTGALVYLSTEILGYQKGTLFRMQSLVWLLVLGIIIAIYDAVVSDEGYRFLPRKLRQWHGLVVLFSLVAVQIDSLVRDPGFWKYLLPFDLILIALALFNFAYYIQNAPDERTKTQ